MRIVSFVTETGEARVGLVEGAEVVDLTSDAFPTALRLVEWACEHGRSLAEAAEEAATHGARRRRRLSDLEVAPAPGRAHLALPLGPPEVWGAGIT